MCQPRQWWVGLVPLAVIWLGAMALLAPEVESELTHRIRTTIASEMPWAKTTLEGRDVYIEGMAPSADAQRRAVERASAIPGIRLATANPADIAPETKPFTWSANRDPGKVTLSGFVEADGVRAKLLAETAKIFPGHTVIDEMKDGRGAPPTQYAAMTVALGQLVRLQTGSVALSDSTLSIKGAAADQATASSIKAASKQIPAPIQVASVDISAPAPPPPPAVTAPQPQARPPQPAPPVASKPPALAVESPYVFQAVRQDDVMTLTGFAPSEAARSQTVNAAKSAMLGGRVVDELRLAGGLPSGFDFAAATAFACGQLGQLRTGTARITDGTLNIAGQALDVASYRAAYVATSGQLPAGMKLERSEIIPPPVDNYTWKVSRTANTLKFGGYYPDEDARRTMVSALQRFPNNLALQDDTSIGSGAPAGFIPAMAMGLDQLSRLETGEAQIQNGELSIDGVAPSERVANEVKDAASKLVGGMKVLTHVTFVPPLTAPAQALPAAPAKPAAPPPATTVMPPAQSPPVTTTPAPPPTTTEAAPAAAPPAIAKPSPEAIAACTADLADSVRSGQLLFASSKAVVLPASRTVINRIAEAMKRCPAMRIEIAGHTDATGTPGFNETLSRDRADAIAALLAGTGVDASRMRTAGYGSSKPVADNVSPAGKARNRRIEFTVVE